MFLVKQGMLNIHQTSYSEGEPISQYLRTLKTSGLVSRNQQSCFSKFSRNDNGKPKQKIANKKY